MPSVSRSVLVVDSDREVVDAFIRMLSAAGLEVRGADNRAAARELLEVDPPRLVIVEPGIPEASALIADVRRTVPEARIVAFAWPEATVAEGGRAAESGTAGEAEARLAADRFVSKLASLDEVFDVVASLTGWSVRARMTERPSALIVDDDPLFREAIVVHLESAGYRMFSARTASESLQLLDIHAAIDVVLVDVILPDEGGLELIREILARQKPPGVIAMSSMNDRVIAARAVELGAFDFLAKPVDTGRLEAKLEACIGHEAYKRLPWWKRLAA